MATPSGTVQQSSLPNGRPRIEERVWILENLFNEDGVLNPDHIPLSSAVDSTREDVAATSLAVKKTYDEATKKGTLKQAGRVQLCNEFIEDDTKAATPSLAKKANDLAQDALDKANEADDKAEGALNATEKAGLTAADIFIGPSTGYNINYPLAACFEEGTGGGYSEPLLKKGYDWLIIDLMAWDSGGRVFDRFRKAKGGDSFGWAGAGASPMVVIRLKKA